MTDRYANQETSYLLQRVENSERLVNPMPTINPWLCSVPHGEMSAGSVFWGCAGRFFLPRLQVSGAGSPITMTSESRFGVRIA